MNQMKLNVEKVKANKRMEKKKEAKDIMAWAVRKQRAHDQAVLANMWFGMDKSQAKE